jgi:hypothetical protein
VALVASLCLAVPAYASSGTKVIADCNAHNMLTRHYTIPQLQNALSTMPADVAEYTNCHDVIQRALLTQEGKLHAADRGSGRAGPGRGDIRGAGPAAPARPQLTGESTAS